MIKQIKNIAKKKPLIWALTMAVISSLILLLWGGFQIYNENNVTNDNYDDVELLSILIKVIFYFILFFLFFYLFSIKKAIKLLYRMINNVLFFLILFSIYIYASSNMEYLDKTISFIPIKKWVKNGCQPPEEEISDVFFLLILTSLSFLNILFLNLFPKKK